MRRGSKWEFEPDDSPIVEALSKDLRQAAAVLRDQEARFLVDYYYQAQDERVRVAGQIRSSQETEPNAVLQLMLDATQSLEKRIKQALDIWTEQTLIGRWCKAQYGIGPVITAGILSQVDLKQTRTAARLWRFAGLDPTVEWGKGEKRPWNGMLKVLCWKAGESFVKFSGRDDCFYGKLYASRKAYECQKDAEGGHSAAAEEILAKKRFGKETMAYAAYSEGHLPDAHLHARAKRYAVKIFLSHLVEIAWYANYGELSPAPFAMEHLGHADYIPPPHPELIPGLVGAMQKAGRLPKVAGSPTDGEYYS